MTGPTYTGPCKLPCEQQCDVPAGYVMAAVPRPRHAWGDMFNCPNCELSLMLQSGPNDTAAGR